MKKTRFVLFAALVAAIAVAFTGCANAISGVPAEKQGIYVPAKVIYTEGDEEVIDIVDWTAKTCTTNGVPCDFYETYEYWETAWKVEATKAYIGTDAVTNSEFQEYGYLAYDEWGDSDYETKMDGNNLLLQIDFGILGKGTYKTFYASDDPNYSFYTFYEHEETSSLPHYTKKIYYKIF